ncbi:hypothetical protein XENTR_v10013717 [Xenopus tropicalis]|nr:hypothetical protein XENTR_v10023251 [Xenopus tropicalis]KAE8601560.1 hypothetical protein XENTR_v10013717 [Xenopus tropicalis]
MPLLQPSESEHCHSESAHIDKRVNAQSETTTCCNSPRDIAHKQSNNPECCISASKDTDSIQKVTQASHRHSQLHLCKQRHRPSASCKQLQASQSPSPCIYFCKD